MSQTQAHAHAKEIGSTQGWLTKSEVAARLGISEKTVDRLHERGKLERRVQSQVGKADRPVFNPKHVEELAPKEESSAQGPSATDLALVYRPMTVVHRPTEEYQPQKPVGYALPPSELRHKRYLTLREAADYTGAPMSVIERSESIRRLEGTTRKRFLREDLDKL